MAKDPPKKPGTGRLGLHDMRANPKAKKEKRTAIKAYLSVGGKLGNVRRKDAISAGRQVRDARPKMGPAQTKGVIAGKLPPSRGSDKNKARVTAIYKAAKASGDTKKAKNALKRLRNSPGILRKTSTSMIGKGDT